MEVNNIMETKGCAGYPGQLKKIIKSHMMWEKVDPNMKHSFQMVFDLFDWFQAENVHRFRPGAAIKTEKYLLKHFKQQATEYIQRLECYEKAYEARTRVVQHPPMSIDRIPEDLFPEIMSYLSPIVRLENLRRKYTNEFLSKNLNRKKIHQLKNIHDKYEDTLLNTFGVYPNRGMYGLNHISDSIMGISQYMKGRTGKELRVRCILQLYLAVENHLMTTLISRPIYDKYCELVVKMLHLLVIVCQNPTKVSHRKRGCHEARIMTRVPHALYTF